MCPVILFLLLQFIIAIRQANSFSTLLKRHIHSQKRQTFGFKSLFSLENDNVVVVPNDDNVPETMIQAMYRYAVKGLSGDELRKVNFPNKGDTFPDDRRFALRFENSTASFVPQDPQWVHKQNFLCAFTAPELLSQYKSTYDIKESSSSKREIQRILTLAHCDTPQDVILRVDLSSEEGQTELADYFSNVSQQKVQVVTQTTSNNHIHQFGNTQSGVRHIGDTRTVHIVNQATTIALGKKLGHDLKCTRFRPNIIVDTHQAWQENEWVGQSLKIGSELVVDVISRTIRCHGISADPTLPKGQELLDIPGLLQKHFPEVGPYFGVYAIVRQPGTIEVGDSITVLGDSK